MYADQRSRSEVRSPSLHTCSSQCPKVMRKIWGLLLSASHLRMQISCLSCFDASLQCIWNLWPRTTIEEGIFNTRLHHTCSWSVTQKYCSLNSRQLAFSKEGQQYQPPYFSHNRTTLKSIWRHTSSSLYSPTPPYVFTFNALCLGMPPICVVFFFSKY